MNAYSNCKYGATYDSLGTTTPLPLSSIFHCGEWAFGVVLDIYCKFTEACDHYIDYILSGLYTCSVDFGVLPTRFTVPSDNPRVQEALVFCFGKIIEVESARKSDENNCFKALLLWCLGSLIFHSYELCTIMSSRPSCPFYNIPIFQNPKLLESLITLVTTYPTPNVMTVGTGIPPNTKIIK